MATLNKKEKDFLMKVITATTADETLYIAESKTAKKLIEMGLIEINPNDINEGKAACRATQKALGSDALEPATETAPTPAQDEFELESGIEMPTVRRGRSGSTRYPFEKMEVGQSFHVPATEENDNPAKKIASTVSGVIKRNRNEDGSKGKDFAVRRVDASDPKGPGARVFRVG